MEKTIVSLLVFGISLCFATLIFTGVYAYYEQIGVRGWLKEFGTVLSITVACTVAGTLIMLISTYLAFQITSFFF